MAVLLYFDQMNATLVIIRYLTFNILTKHLNLFQTFYIKQFVRKVTGQRKGDVKYSQIQICLYKCTSIYLPVLSQMFLVIVIE